MTSTSQTQRCTGKGKNVGLSSSDGNQTLLVPTESSKKRTKCESPGLLKLIKNLRATYPIDEVDRKDGSSSRRDRDFGLHREIEKAEQTDGEVIICHETGERLSTEEVRHADVKADNRKGVSFSPDALIMDALIEKSAEDLDKLLVEQHDIDVNKLNPNGDTLLHIAAREGDVECLQTLIRHGADLNKKNMDGWPAVHSALQQAQLPAMIYLIECGTDMEEYTNMRVHEYQSVQKISKTVYKEKEVFV